MPCLTQPSGDTRAYSIRSLTRCGRNWTRDAGKQMGDARFREYLIESQAPVMGVATMKKADLRPDLVTLRG